MAYSVVLLHRSGDRRFGFLTVMLTLMAARQVWTFGTGGSTGFEEFPGLIVSFLALATVHYLAQYVTEEKEIKSELASTNDRLKSFREAVEHAGHAIFLTDPDGTIEYANPAAERVTGYSRGELVGENPRLWKSGEHDDEFYEVLWKTIRDGSVWEGEIVNQRRNGENFWVDATIAPIIDRDGGVEQFVAVENDITDRKVRELRIDEQNARLELLNTTNEIIRDVNRELVRADSKAEIETAVCERFAGSQPYESAWLATRNAVSDTVRARSHAGVDECTISDMLSAINEADDQTIVDSALDANTTRIARTCDETAADCECYEYVDAEVTVAIPLSYRDAHYGALVLHAESGRAAETLEPDVLDELGETIAYSITAAESRRTLLSDRVTEFSFSLTAADDPLVALASTLECELELERVSIDGDGTPVHYVELTGASAARARAAAVDRFAETRVVRDGDDDSLLALIPMGNSITETLAEYGASVNSLTADEDGGTLTAELSGAADVRTVVSAVTETHSSAELVGIQERDREPDTYGGFRADVEERLTERQLEAVELAYFGGFFDWPRGSTGEELAERMGIGQSTYLQHLRVAQRKFFDAFFRTDRSTRLEHVVSGY